jgi:hypothetical protein
MKPWKYVPEIEPLSDTAWRRIEREVFTDLDRNRGRELAEPSPPHWLVRWRRPLLGMGVGLAAAAALLLVLRGNPDGSGPQPSRIVTDEAQVELTVGRAAIRVAPASAVWVQSNHGHEVMMILEQGRVACTVAHDESRPPLVVQAGDVRVEVVGTSFAVTRQGASAMVEVHEGVVEVFHDGRRTRVGAGQRWTPAELSPAVSARAAAIEAGGAQPALPAPAGSQPSVEDVAGAGAAAGAADVVADDREPDPVDQAAQRATRRREVATSEPGAPAEPAADPKQRYEQAARLEAAEPAAAIAIYRELARGKGVWAANALFAQARLELDRGRTAEAVRLLDIYLRRYPGGNNAADARALLDATGRPASGR